jgi:N-acetylneuraminic acid mutarotase
MQSLRSSFYFSRVFPAQLSFTPFQNVVDSPNSIAIEDLDTQSDLDGATANDNLFFSNNVLLKNKGNWTVAVVLQFLAIVLLLLSPLIVAFSIHFSVKVKADCLSCTLAEQFPELRQQLQGQVPWTATPRRFGKRTVAGLAATASTDIHPPKGLKPLEQKAWVAMAERGKMQLFLPQHYNGFTIVEQGAVRVEVQPLGAQVARAERQGKTLVYRNIYPSTDSLQVVKPGRSEEFLYLRERSAPQSFDYQVRVGQGVKVHSVRGSIAFVDSRGRGVRIERPWLVDSRGRRSESAVHWQVLEGGRRLRLVVEPQGLSYPLVVDPTWSTTASMSTARLFHTATLLRNGNILVAGGVNNGVYFSSAEVYNPKTGTWSTTGSMSTARIFHTATLLRNGNVLVAGGVSSNGPNVLNNAEVYNPKTGIWSTTGSMSTGRVDHTATLLKNGKVLVVEGSDSNGVLSSAEVYNPEEGTWSITGSLNTARQADYTATLLNNGKVLVVGGDNGSISAELYDPSIGSWNTTGSMSTGRFFHTATLLRNGKVLVAGGCCDVNGVVLSSVEVYNPAVGTWSNTGSMITGRGIHTATLLNNGKVLVAGGTDGSNVFSSAEVYNPAVGTWSTTGPMSTAREYHTATLLNNGKVLVAGGTDISNVFSSAELYGLSEPGETTEPIETSFSPTSTPVVSLVTITGSGVTSVRVNGLSASFGFMTDSQLKALK